MSNEIEYAETAFYVCPECEGNPEIYAGETPGYCTQCNGKGQIEVELSDEHCDECDCELNQEELKHFDGLCWQCHNEQRVTYL